VKPEEFTKAKVVGYTQPSEEFKDSFKDVKDLVAFCARVSNPSNQYNTDTSDKLIKYLLKHKHFSPFEMASITLEIETTRDIARQLLRHRSFTFQEYSQRYADPTKDLVFVTREARLQDPKNRQNSVVLDMQDVHDRILASLWQQKQEQIIDLVKESYVWAVNAGIAKEQARAILPEGCTMSRLYVQGTVRSFIHYIEVRTEEGVQEEHRVLAKAVAEAVSTVFKIE
jgi:thymidylate synthase (FAD)